MKIDDEFSEAVGKAKESQQKQYEEYNAKQLERKAAEKAKSSWAVK
jgi:hypothetical protein